MSKLTKKQIAEREESLSYLRNHIKPGDTVYAIVRSVSKSRMSRKISFFLNYQFVDGPEMHPISYHVARVLG